MRRKPRGFTLNQTSPSLGMHTAQVRRHTARWACPDGKFLEVSSNRFCLVSAACVHLPTLGSGILLDAVGSLATWQTRHDSDELSYNQQRVSTVNTVTRTLRVRPFLGVTTTEYLCAIRANTEQPSTVTSPSSARWHHRRRHDWPGTRASGRRQREWRPSMALIDYRSALEHRRACGAGRTDEPVPAMTTATRFWRQGGAETFTYSCVYARRPFISAPSRSARAVNTPPVVATETRQLAARRRCLISVRWFAEH